ncbi:hypothetical protein ACQ86N_44940 [Puia sp. P3]|uniref:hypothetical protein n=1 Tax=Puia sp. P3 TaxID=3423952 RepID=UPI003D6651B8
MDTDTALLGKLHENDNYEKIFSIGPIEQKINMIELIGQVKSVRVNDGEVAQFEDVVLARLDNYTVFAILKKQERLKTEKMYLLKLFVLNAAKAIRNAEASGEADAARETVGSRQGRQHDDARPSFAHQEHQGPYGYDA